MRTHFGGDPVPQKAKDSKPFSPAPEAEPGTPPSEPEPAPATDDLTPEGKPLLDPERDQWPDEAKELD